MNDKADGGKRTKYKIAKIMKNKVSKTGKKIKNGFSLMEVMISIAIISIGIVSIFSLFSATLKSEMTTNNRLTAIYLAQEGIEAVRQLRDTNWKAGNPWDAGITDVSEGEKVVGFKTCDGDGCSLEDGFEVTDHDTTNEKVYIDNDDNYYGQYGDSSIPDAWEETGFKRWLDIRKVRYDGITADQDYMQVISYVSYNGTVLAELKVYLNRWK